MPSRRSRGGGRSPGAAVLGVDLAAVTEPLGRDAPAAERERLIEGSRQLGAAGPAAGRREAGEGHGQRRQRRAGGGGDRPHAVKLRLSAHGDQST
jgi:hypothetical protein